MEAPQAMDSANAPPPDIRTPSRLESERLRRKPNEVAHLVATFDRGDGVFSQGKGGPVEIAIQATNSLGELAPWLDDLWWTDAITRWANENVTVRIAPTPGALLNPILLYQLQMLRRVVPHWRLVGHAYADDLSGPDQIRQVVLSPYHELRFIDQPRPGGQMDRDSMRPLPETFGLIREQQRQLGLSLPTLTRLAPSPA